MNEPFLFLDRNTAIALPATFDYYDYIQVEQEFWALFPETQGRRVNFTAIGLTGMLYASVPDAAQPLAAGETYFLIPCADGCMRPVRMMALRRLSLVEYRMAHLSGVKLRGVLEEAGRILLQVTLRILGDEVVAETLAASEEGAL